MASTPNLNPPVSSAAVHAAIFQAKAPRRGENPDPESGSDRVKCVPARAEAAFHGALNPGFAVELTREPGERTGVTVEERGTVEEITTGRSELHELEWRRAMAKKSSWQRGEDDTEKVSGEPIEQAVWRTTKNATEPRPKTLPGPRQGRPSPRVNAIGRGGWRPSAVGRIRPLSGPAWKRGGLRIHPTRNTTRAGGSSAPWLRLRGKYRRRRSNADGRCAMAGRTPHVYR